MAEAHIPLDWSVHAEGRDSEPQSLPFDRSLDLPRPKPDPERYAADASRIPTALLSAAFIAWDFRVVNGLGGFP
jgi:hypothetical protein